jgi:hypothetical protein
LEAELEKLIEELNKLKCQKENYEKLLNDLKEDLNKKEKETD